MDSVSEMEKPGRTRKKRPKVKNTEKATKPSETKPVEAKEEPAPSGPQKTWFDPTWRFDDLPDLAKRVLTIEIANPDIPVTEIIRLMNFDGDRNRIYEVRKLPLYQKLLSEARKTVFDHIMELQLKAVKKISKLIDSRTERVSLEASKFMLSHSKEIALKKAELELARETALLNAKTPQRIQVEFVRNSAGPQLGKTVMTRDGRFVPRDSEEGQAILAEGKLIEQKPEQVTQPSDTSPSVTSQPEAEKPVVNVTVERPKPPKGQDDDEGGGVIGGIE